MVDCTYFNFDLNIEIGAEEWLNSKNYLHIIGAMILIYGFICDEGILGHHSKLILVFLNLYLLFFKLNPQFLKLILTLFKLVSLF